MTRSRGSGCEDWVIANRGLSRAPGNVPAEADERQQKDEQRNRQQPDYFALIASTLARLQLHFASLGT